MWRLQSGEGVNWRIKSFDACLMHLQGRRKKNLRVRRRRRAEPFLLSKQKDGIIITWILFISPSLGFLLVNRLRNSFYTPATKAIAQLISDWTSPATSHSARRWPTPYARIPRLRLFLKRAAKSWHNKPVWFSLLWNVVCQNPWWSGFCCTIVSRAWLLSLRWRVTWLTNYAQEVTLEKGPLPMWIHQHVHIGYQL